MIFHFSFYISIGLWRRLKIKERNIRTKARNNAISAAENRRG